MKKTIISLILLASLVSPCFAADGNIAKVEVKPDVATWALDTVKFLVFTQTCEVTYRKLDSEGNVLSGEKVIRFQNIADDPETEEDETSTEFSQIVQLINNNNNIKTSITTAVKSKLGL